MFLITLTICLLSSGILGEEYDLEEDARLAYYTNTAEGTSYATFNGTSMQNLVVLGVILVVLGSLLLPYYGITSGILGLVEEDQNENKNDFSVTPDFNQNVDFSGYQGVVRKPEDSIQPVWNSIMNYENRYGK